MQTIQNTQLRNLVVTIDAVLADMLKAPPGVLSDSSLAELKLEWAKLVGVLALGPEPEVRACPTCGRTVMRAATRCGYCWSSLPLAKSNGT